MSMKRTGQALTVLLLLFAFGCSGAQETVSPIASQSPTNNTNTDDAGETGDTAVQETSGTIDDLLVVANPTAAVVLVNKQYSLPEGYEPQDLVYPDVAFTFTEKIDKRMLRKEAADALEQLFAGASGDGIQLAGVSGYRSYDRQKTLFDNYVKKDGEEAARMYSAFPGTSEHQTGLAIDVTGADGKCAAEDCFAATPEAGWLADHAWEYGYIIRYPEGKDSITGYKYEPWHIRYVGKELAKELNERDITLDEYYSAVPVSEKR